MLARLVSLLSLLVSTMALAAPDVKTYIPPQAYQYFPVINKEVHTYLPSFYQDKINYFPALIEHESCISLTHSKCWNSLSRLKTAREEGAGISQLTRAYNPDGSIRFDIIADLKAKHTQALKDLSWSNVYQRPDLQIRAMVLLTKSSYDRLTIPGIAPMDHIAFTDAAYNGGLGGVMKERRACGLSVNCDPRKWFSNVEKYCMKSKKPLYSGRSACDINRHHVYDVLNTRMPKYQDKF